MYPMIHFSRLFLLHLLLCALGVIPESGILRAELLFFELYGLCVDVKVAMQGFCAILRRLELFNGYHVC